MEVVITGANSFIGYRYLKAALNKGWNIVAVVRRNSLKTKELNNNPKIQVIELNMNEYSKLGSIVGKVDCLIHFSWDGTRGETRNDKQLQKKNYEYSMQLINSIIDRGCQKIITAGSQAEYGLCNGIISETRECNPNTQYGIYKLKVFSDTYKLCKEKGVSYKEPRIFSLYGPGDYENTLIMSCIRNMIAGKPCNMTPCVQEWDYLFIDDAIEALIALTEKNCADGVYNLGSGDCRQLKNYVSEIKKILNSNSELNFGAIPYSKTGVVSIHPEIRKIVKETGWTPMTSFKCGIEKTIQWVIS